MRAGLRWTPTAELSAKRELNRELNREKFTPPKLVQGSYELNPIMSKIDGAVPRALVVLPIQVVNEKNARDHWQSVARRKASQREKTFVGLLCLGRADWRTDIRMVRFVRLYGRYGKEFDPKDWTSGCAAVRDEIAWWLEGCQWITNKRGKRVKKAADDSATGQVSSWGYAQEKAEGYGLRCELYTYDPRTA